MELQYSSLVVIVTLAISSLLLWLAKNYYKPKSSSLHKLPPGPWKLPLIGNLHQLATTSSSLPHQALRELAHKHGPLMHLQLGEISAVIVSSPDMAREIMKTHDLAFANRPEFLASRIMAYGSVDIAFAPYSEYWRQMRKICTLELLSPKKVRSFSYIRQEEIAKLIETIESSSIGEPINLSRRISRLISAVVSRAAFGKITEDHEQFLSLAKETVELADGFALEDLFPSLKPLHFVTGLKTKLVKIHAKVDKILEKIVKENQVKQLMREKEEFGEEKNENLVEVLLRVLQSGTGTFHIPITNNIKAVIMDIFTAGTDTSATVIEWAIAELMRSPRVREKAQAEIRQAWRGKETIHEEEDSGDLSYLKAVIGETLRLHPPLPLLLPRECREECRINGYDLPIKTKVIVNAYAVGRDHDHWNEAESFIPERFHGNPIDFKGNNFEYIPFGAGRRICPGLSLGLANVEFALAKLLYHFNWELPKGMKPEDLDMDEGFGAVAGRKNNLYLIPTPYNSSVHDTGN